MREFANDICLAFFVSSLDRYWNDHIQRKSVLNKGGARGHRTHAEEASSRGEWPTDLTHTRKQ